MAGKQRGVWIASNACGPRPLNRSRRTETLLSRRPGGHSRPVPERRPTPVPVRSRAAINYGAKKKKKKRHVITKNNNAGTHDAARVVYNSLIGPGDPKTGLPMATGSKNVLFYFFFPREEREKKEILGLPRK